MQWIFGYSGYVSPNASECSMDMHSMDDSQELFHDDGDEKWR